MAIEQNMLDALIQHQVYSYRASTKVVNELNADFVSATNSFSNTLRDLLDSLTDAEKEALTQGKYTTDTLKEVKTAFDEWYNFMYVSMPETFAFSAVALATYEAMYVSKLYGEEVELSGTKILANAKKTPVIGGQLYDDIWRTLATSTREKALYAVREGINQGLTTAQIVNQIRGTRTKVGDKYQYIGGIASDLVGEGTKKGAIDAAVRTIRSHVATTATNDTFEALGFDYVKFVSTLDGRTTKGCASLDQTVWKRGDKSIVYPPRHYNCRSILVGVNKDGDVAGKRPFVSSDKPVSKIPKDQREGKIGQVDANESFSSWFSRQPVSFQKDYLGKTQYELYKNGGYTLDRFVDPLGNDYTIAELKELDAKTFKELGL